MKEHDGTDLIQCYGIQNTASHMLFLECMAKFHFAVNSWRKHTISVNPQARNHQLWCKFHLKT